MENNDEKEVFEDCIEEKQEDKQQSENAQPQNETKENENSNQEKNENNIKEDEKEKQNDNKSDEENENNDKENKKEKYIPYTIKQAQEKEKENDDYSFPEKDEKDSDKEEDHEPEQKEKLTEEEKKDIEEKIINERKNAGDLYKNKEYIQALNTYSLLLTDAKRADLKEQCCILNCNKGICFNKLYEYDKALDCFKEALKYNKDYSKALCNKMLLLHKKEEYLEAYEDFKRLKTLDYHLWENYRNMENELAYKAEIQKKKMTDEMLGKLKDVGNTILGKFGLSLNNFKMTPNGQGGYSIQYNNNK